MQRSKTKNKTIKEKKGIYNETKIKQLVTVVTTVANKEANETQGKSGLINSTSSFSLSTSSSWRCRAETMTAFRSLHYWLFSVWSFILKDWCHIWCYIWWHIVDIFFQKWLFKAECKRLNCLTEARHKTTDF